MRNDPIIVVCPHDHTEEDIAALKTRLSEKFGCPVIVQPDPPPGRGRNMAAEARQVVPRSALASFIGDIYNRPPAVAPIRVKCKYQRKLLGLDP